MRNWLYDPWSGPDEQPPRHLALWWNVVAASEVNRRRLAYRVGPLMRRAKRLRLKLLPTRLEHLLNNCNERAWALKKHVEYPARPGAFLVLPVFDGWQELPAVILDWAHTKRFTKATPR